ncbi:MAG: DUF1292 domain-containing protein [Ruminococcus sp.]|jgi:hypothetical protein|nr:DUF1292 domain-containing protein [Ruminococcus sp.]
MSEKAGDNNINQADDGFERKIIELQDEDGKSEQFELLGDTEYEGVRYFILSEYIPENIVDNPDDPISTFVMKNIGEDETDIQLETVMDEELGLAVFNKFFNELDIDTEDI